MEENKTSSSNFSREHKLELCDWLKINHLRLDSLIESADLKDLQRLTTFSGKDDLYDSLFHKVDMLNVQPDMSKFQGGCVVDGGLYGFDPNVDPKVWKYGIDDEIICVVKAITEESCDEIKSYYLSQVLDKSDHITCWDNEFANEMFIIIDGVLSAKECNSKSSTDWWQRDNSNDLTKVDRSNPTHVSRQSKSWKPVGITPLVRFVTLKKGEGRNAHYDSGFIYDNPNYRTLMSGILYLSNNLSGATRFIRDKQVKLGVCDRKHDDHLKKTKDIDVRYIFYPDKGSIILYDHRLLHDIQTLEKDHGDRTLIRFDIVYQANT